MVEKSDFVIRFWGVRGSIACAGEDFHRYGGNTPCVEVRCGDKLLILDAGTGLKALGVALDGAGDLNADILLTHTHIDHIVGLPFFRPLYDLSATVRVWAGHLLPAMTLQDALGQFMAAPLFPIPPEAFSCGFTYMDFRAGQGLELGPGLEIRTAPLRHPNGATGYRITFGGRSLCYVTDTEHQEGQLDAEIVALIAGADLVIYDSTYTDEEYPKFRNWGHSTWQEGVRLCNAAGAKRLVIFHHDPAHDDVFMDQVAAAAASARPGTVVAREGMVLSL